MEILICTDGTESSIKASELVTRFGFPTKTELVVLGVSESEDNIEKLAGSMEAIQKKVGIGFTVYKKLRRGNPLDEILAEVIDSSYDLVVVGGGGTQMGLLHPKIGETTSKLARKLDTHFLVVRNIPEKFDKILFCAGPDTPASEIMSVGGKWIANTNAQVGLLHVITSSQVNTNIVRGNESMPYDQLMDRFIQQLHDAGCKNEIERRIRQGLVVEEVLKELSEGDYQLLVIGAHYLPGQDPWQGTLLDDITDQLLNRSNCSVLII